MRKPARLAAISFPVAAALLAVGCAGDNPAPQRPVSYQPVQNTMARPQQPVAQNPRVPIGPTFSSPTPMAQDGTFAWQPTLQQAKSLARSTRRMVFVEAGREACGNCQALKRRIIPTPEMSAALGSVAVGFYDDVDNSPYSESFNSLQQHLPGAAVLPLCGFFTPDMQWVSGFSGHTDAGQLRDHIATAEAAYRRMAVANEPPETSSPAMTGPAPAFPDAELATVAPANADNGEIDLGATAAETVAKVEPAVATAPVAPPAPPVDSGEIVVDLPAMTSAPAVTVAPPAPPTVVAPPVVEQAPVAVATESVPQLFQHAVDAMTARNYAQARSILADIKARTAGQPEQRDADKGEVAIYNLRKIDAASGATQTALRAQAGADLKNTVWAVLFR